MSLIARYLEENGIPTVIIGAARDIVEHCGVARFVFVDFPLGSPCGEPWKVDQQREIFGHALDLLENARGPRTTRAPSLTWSKGYDWKRLVFSDEQPWQDPGTKAEWLARKEEYRRLKSEGKGVMADKRSEVIVYTSPMCSPCEQLKRYLTKLGVSYRVRDLLMDENAQDRLDKARVRSTPALEVDGVIYSGDALTPQKVRELVGV